MGIPPQLIFEPLVLEFILHLVETAHHFGTKMFCCSSGVVLAGELFLKPLRVHGAHVELPFGMQPRFDDLVLHPQVHGIVRYPEPRGNLFDGALPTVVEAIIETLQTVDASDVADG